MRLAGEGKGRVAELVKLAATKKYITKVCIQTSDPYDQLAYGWPAPNYLYYRFQL